MTIRTRFAILRQNPVIRIGLLLLGVIFLIITPLLGPLPGPGGVFTFAIGAGLVLRNSVWARKRYVRFKKRKPKMGGWADWGLRRQSAKRRIERDKQQQKAGTQSGQKTGTEN
jgi:hypothetical protein